VIAGVLMVDAIIECAELHREQPVEYVSRRTLGLSVTHAGLCPTE
jgi:hypothetical protein